MAQTVDVTLSTKGLDTGNFTLTALDNAGVAVSGWTKTGVNLVAGTPIRYTDVPDTAYQIKVQSATTYCTNSINLRFKTL
jgi:hypothetical protein